MSGATETKSRWWTWAWVAWIVTFFVIELPAIFNKEKDDTLSEHFQRWFRTDTKAGRYIWIAVFGFFAAWFAIHIGVQGAA